MSDETTVTTDSTIGGDGPVKPAEQITAGGEAPPIIAAGAPIAEVQDPSVLDRIKEILHAFEHQSVTIARELAQKWHDEF